MYVPGKIHSRKKEHDSFQGVQDQGKSQAIHQDQQAWIALWEGWPHKQDWKDCVMFGGLDKDQYPFAVQWHESQF